MLSMSDFTLKPQKMSAMPDDYEVWHTKIGLFDIEVKVNRHFNIYYATVNGQRTTENYKGYNDVLDELVINLKKECLDILKELNETL
jgi:hypothetical protein